MAKELAFTFFRKKPRTMTKATIPLTTITLLLLITIMFTGTITNVVNVWAGTFPGPNGQIAFVSIRDGNEDIYVMNADGSGQTRLTNDPANDLSPSWSPDGEKIAFSSFRDSTEGNDNEDIYVMNADDGSGQTRLTNDPADDKFASWSPDGEKIAFSSNRDNGDNEIYVMNADDGSQKIRLTNNNANDLSSDWGTNALTLNGDGSSSTSTISQQTSDETLSVNTNDINNNDVLLFLVDGVECFTNNGQEFSNEVQACLYDTIDQYFDNSDENSSNNSDSQDNNISRNNNDNDTSSN
jgi:hypothetical protein